MTAFYMLEMFFFFLFLLLFLSGILSYFYLTRQQIQYVIFRLCKWWCQCLQWQSDELLFKRWWKQSRVSHQLTYILTKNQPVIVITLPSCHMLQLTILPSVLYVHKVMSSGVYLLRVGLGCLHLFCSVMQRAWWGNAAFSFSACHSLSYLFPLMCRCCLRAFEYVPQPVSSATTSRHLQTAKSVHLKFTKRLVC